MSTVSLFEVTYPHLGSWNSFPWSLLGFVEVPGICGAGSLLTAPHTPCVAPGRPHLDISLFNTELQKEFPPRNCITHSGGRFYGH